MKKMLDLFCGTKSMAKAFEERDGKLIQLIGTNNLSQH